MDAKFPFLAVTNVEDVLFFETQRAKDQKRGKNQEPEVSSGGHDCDEAVSVNVDVQGR